MSYKIANDEDKKRLDINEDYDAIFDEAGNIHFLGEPEDRTWRRDLAPVLTELNETSAQLSTALKMVGELATFLQPLLDVDSGDHEAGWHWKQIEGGEIVTRAQSLLNPEVKL